MESNGSIQLHIWNRMVAYEYHIDPYDSMHRNAIKLWHGTMCSHAWDCMEAFWIWNLLAKSDLSQLKLDFEFSLQHCLCSTYEVFHSSLNLRATQFELMNQLNETQHLQ